MQKNWYGLMETEQKKQELARVLACNGKTRQFGLTLTVEEAEGLLLCRHDTLKAHGRIEFGGGILSELIEAFCDSPYLEQDGFADALERLQSAFYLYKNEAKELLTDDELLGFMKEQFDGVCWGSVECLEDTCLERFARAVRAGYRDYVAGGGIGEYGKFSEEIHWDRNLFLEKLYDLLS